MIKILETCVFKLNPYNLCVDNKIIEGDPLTILFHVDEVKEVHKEKNVVDIFENWIDFMYGYPEIGKFTLARGKFHEYSPP